MRRRHQTLKTERNAFIYAAWRFTLAIASAGLFSSCVLLQSHRRFSSGMVPGEQPDKILYQKAEDEITHSRYEVGRLTLQTLINTYPDSEYLAKAKLAIADSYYKQGGVSGLTQAEAEYKDFITFFPTAPEAPMAQYRVGLAHFRLMGKPDRDLTEARAAEAEFGEFLHKYPDSPLMPEVKARLRAVQEVLAQGEFRIAEFYMQQGANPAARARLEDIVNKYPSFSRADAALWDLTETLDRLKQPKAAIVDYDRLITEYPLSPYVSHAKRKLEAQHQPIPRPTKAEQARARADRADRTSRSLLAKVGGIFSSAPDLSQTRHGPVIPLPVSELEVQVAKNSGQSGTGNNTVTAQPISDAGLKSGTPVDPQTLATKPAVEKKPSSQKTQETATHTETKKGMLHLFKKLIPF